MFLLWKTHIDCGTVLDYRRLVNIKIFVIMKRSKIIFRSVAAIIGVMLFILSCQKNISGDLKSIPSGKSKLSVYLLDGPNDYQQVNIDIRGILVKVDTCTHNGRGDDDDDDHGDDDHDSMDVKCDIWDTLDINKGIYDLLKLQNGVDTLLASGYIPQGKIEKIKFLLGTNNSVMVDSVIHDLKLRGNINFIYLKIKHENIDSLTNNNFQLYLDFDLARSIQFINGNYWLKPVLKPFGKHSTGEIEGKIRPVQSHGLIKAYNSTDTAFARPDDNEGEFKIRGLKPGTYDLFIDGINGYRDTTITQIVVIRGKETELGTILLKK